MLDRFSFSYLFVPLDFANATKTESELVSNKLIKTFISKDTECSKHNYIAHTVHKNISTMDPFKNPNPFEFTCGSKK